MIIYLFLMGNASLHILPETQRRNLSVKSKWDARNILYDFDQFWHFD